MRSPRPALARRLLALAALALLALLAACSRSGGGEAAPAGKAKVKLFLNWVPEPEFGGFYAAREGGAFAKENLEVEIVGGGAGAPVLQSVASGQADFGIVGADELLTARARGVDVIPIFAVHQTFPQGIMAHASRGAKGIGDVLASGTLAIEPGAPYAQFLKKKFGFDKVNAVPYDGGVARFLAEKDFAQQCYVTSEPIAAKKKGSDPVVFLIADEGFNPYATVVITRRALWNENPERVRAFRRAIAEGWRAYLADPAPANQVMGKLNTSMDAATFAEVAEVQKPLIETADTKAKGLGAMTRERWEALGRQLVDIGLLDKQPAIDDLLVAAP